MPRVRFIGTGCSSRSAVGADPVTRQRSYPKYPRAPPEDRTRLRHEIAATFETYHVILAPIAPVPAFPHDQRPFLRRTLTTSDGGNIPYNSMLTWISLATALHLPATAVPAGTTSSGLPVGAQ